MQWQHNKGTKGKIKGGSILAEKKHTFSETSIIIRRCYNDKNNKKEHRIHSNEGHEIFLLLQGDVSFSIDGNIYKIKPQDLLLISNKEIHRPIVNTEVPYERMYIYFDPDFFAQFSSHAYDLLQMFENRRLGFGNKIDSKIVEEYKIYDDFLEIHNWYQSKAPERQTMMISILLQLLVKINRICNENTFAFEKVKEDLGYNEKIYQIIRYTSSHLNRKISLDELESKFYINKYHLCHLFKKITGFTILEYINYKKVLEAREKLKKGISVSDVWIHLGFEDYSSFYRAFKKITGLSPKEYLDSSINKFKKES